MGNRELGGSSAARAARLSHGSVLLLHFGGVGGRDKEASARMSALLWEEKKIRLVYLPSSRAWFRNNDTLNVDDFMGLRGENGASGDGKIQK